MSGAEHESLFQAEQSTKHLPSPPGLGLHAHGWAGQWRGCLRGSQALLTARTVSCLATGEWNAVGVRSRFCNLGSSTSHAAAIATETAQQQEGGQLTSGSSAMVSRSLFFLLFSVWFGGAFIGLLVLNNDGGSENHRGISGGGGGGGGGSGGGMGFSSSLDKMYDWEVNWRKLKLLEDQSEGTQAHNFLKSLRTKKLFQRGESTAENVTAADALKAAAQNVAGDTGGGGGG
eukprot:CAMPEP_0119478474 /NCGR_PEP_ID=MMETSP1344-20130328/8196_1 /TAXON_ID=236787 /ORGANISM="Florenciella parvula, Strain CCMP2471" /LENGTH=230 /DNA_ID=CAMNT_0007512647 /DNA_START=166 /DNA_END=857 /DNA_ORIENTATION=-